MAEGPTNVHDESNLPEEVLRKLNIQAEDIVYKNGEAVDLKKGIVITDETGNSITGTVELNVVNFNGYAEHKTGQYKYRLIIW